MEYLHYYFNNPIKGGDQNRKNLVHTGLYLNIKSDDKKQLLLSDKNR